ncbi:hypothetical protein PR003_g14573 [Phytophthora rubi]|uniref:DUF659 domain-containing protein n=1 Tax=Phytophthora rubi TaxID=129364 RepID=A0A6A4F3T5_9STRA|nr:hypothetical protein PR003_g14573 [Phytophthora rubi]
MAFNKATHPSLLQALQMLHPGVVIPSAHQLSTTLLNMCYRDFKVKMVHKITGKKCTLYTDGWAGVNGKSVINYVLECEGETYFLESVYTGSTSHDALFLAADVKRVIESAKFTTIVAVVTDNTAANQLMWSTLQREYPEMFFHGCIVHVIHLIVKDMVSKLKWLKDLEGDCRKMVKFFKKHHLLWAELRRLQRLEEKSALVLPADTRWGTIEQCFASVLQSESILLSLVSQREFLKAKSKEQKANRRMAHDVITAPDFVPRLKRAIALLSVLSAAQKVFERSSRPISDVYRMFIELPQKYREMRMPIGELDIISGILNERFDFVYGDAHGVSYLLDPRYGGEGMDDDTREKVVEFTANWHGPELEDDASAEVLRYQAFIQKPTRELRLVKDGRVTVQEFWGGLRGFPLLRQVATRVFASGCSSAAAERNFSTHKFVHSAVRNRLKEGSVEKLVFIFFNAKNMDTDEIRHSTTLKILLSSAPKTRTIIRIARLSAIRQ